MPKGPCDPCSCFGVAFAFRLHPIVFYTFTVPELPEVETIARGLDKRVRGDVIDSVWLGKHSEPLKSTAQELASALTATRIAQVRRVGKHLVFDLEPKVPRNGKSARQWIVHLGMTGRMLVCFPDEETPKHTHAIASLSSGRELRFVDPRRFGRLSVTTAQEFAGPGQIFLSASTYSEAMVTAKVRSIGPVRTNADGDTSEAFCLIELLPNETPLSPEVAGRSRSG